MRVFVGSVGIEVEVKVEVEVFVEGEVVSEITSLSPSVKSINSVDAGLVICVEVVVTPVLMARGVFRVKTDLVHTGKFLKIMKK